MLARSGPFLKLLLQLQPTTQLGVDVQTVLRILVITPGTISSSILCRAMFEAVLAKLPFKYLVGQHDAHELLMSLLQDDILGGLKTALLLCQ